MVTLLFQPLLAFFYPSSISEYISRKRRRIDKALKRIIRLKSKKDLLTEIVLKTLIIGFKIGLIAEYSKHSHVHTPAGNWVLGEPIFNGQRVYLPHNHFQGNCLYFHHYANETYMDGGLSSVEIMDAIAYFATVLSAGFMVVGVILSVKTVKIGAFITTTCEMTETLAAVFISGRSLEELLLNNIWVTERHSINPFTSSMARSHWLSIVTGLISGVGILLEHFIQVTAINGQYSSLWIRNTFDRVQLLSVIMDFVEIGNTVSDFWLRDYVTIWEYVELMADILLFAYSIYDYDSANSILLETQIKTIEGARHRLACPLSMKTSEWAVTTSSSPNTIWLIIIANAAFIQTINEDVIFLNG